MSYIYSQALVEASSLGKCSDTEQSALSSGSHTPKPCLWHDKTMEPSRLSRFGMTCKPLTESLGAELLTSWLADFPVRTSAWQEKAQESRVPGLECGDTWPASLARFDPVSCSWKTAQLSLLGDLEQSSVIWPRSGMTAAGQCWELPMLERPTRGTGSGYWRTPTVGMINADRAKDPEYGQRKLAKGQTITLADQVKDIRMWPTPTVCGNYNRKGASATSGDGLATAVRMWPTPQASDNRNRGTKQTPAIARRIEAGKQVMLSMCMDAPLNPEWVEALMGWPVGITSLTPMKD